MKFVYDKKIDKKCKEKLIACDLIFGEKKKVEIYKVEKRAIKKLELLWTSEIDKIFLKGIRKLFRKGLPKNFTCFLNSTPYSMDLDEGISLSVSSETPIKTICHETNHFMFRKSNYKDKFFSSVDIEEAKEIFTIINNLYFQDIMENQDMGWKKFWKKRFQFLKIWLEINQT